MSVFSAKWLLAAASALIFSATLFADEVYEADNPLALPSSQSAPQWRVRGALGIANISEDNYDNAVAFDIAAQKILDDQVAVELGYTHFDQFDHSSLNQSLGAEVLKLSVVGYSKPGDQHRYFFRLGAFRADLELALASSTVSETDSGFFGGFGVACRVMPQLSVTTEVDLLYSATIASEDTNISQISVGLEYEI